MNTNKKANDLELDEPKNQIVVPKNSDSPLMSGYDYIWGSDQDEFVEEKEG